jgi:hypothetical protein
MLRGNPIPESHNGVEITDEMREGAELYVGHISGTEIHIEEPLDISSIHPDCRGTPDCWTISGWDIHIYDYKFGHGFVEVYENWQLIEYAAGIVQRLALTGLQDQAMTVHMHIVQPRSFHPDGQIRTWSIRASGLRGYFNILRSAEDAATGPDPVTIVSSECNYCVARHACSALATASMSAVDVSRSAVPHNLKPVELASELRFLEHAASLLAARISGLSAEALALIKRGVRLPHYQAVQGQGRERWKIPADQVIQLGEMMGVALGKPAVITPKQAIALKSDMLPADIVRQYSETPYGELKLVPLDTRKTDKIFGV